MESYFLKHEKLLPNAWEFRYRIELESKWNKNQNQTKNHSKSNLIPIKKFEIVSNLNGKRKRLPKIWKKVLLKRGMLFLRARRLAQGAWKAISQKFVSLFT